MNKPPTTEEFPEALNTCVGLGHRDYVVYVIVKACLAVVLELLNRKVESRGLMKRVRILETYGETTESGIIDHST